MKLKILVFTFTLLLSAVAFAKGGEYGIVGTDGASANYETHSTGKAFRAHVYDKDGNYLGKTKWRNTTDEAEDDARDMANNKGGGQK